MGTKQYGYARVSSKGQNLSRQYDALIEFGVPRDRIYADKAGGKDFKRPQYQQLMRRLRKDDVLVVKSIDRLGRNYDEIIGEWRRITREKGVAIVVLDLPLLDTRNQPNGLTGAFIAELVLQLMSYIAQMERDDIRQRQMEGIASAKARGVRFGRPPIERPPHYEQIKFAYKDGLMSKREAAKQLAISVSTFDNWLRRDTLEDES